MEAYVKIKSILYMSILLFNHYFTYSAQRHAPNMCLAACQEKCHIRHLFKNMVTALKELAI